MHQWGNISLIPKMVRKLMLTMRHTTFVHTELPLWDISKKCITKSVCNELCYIPILVAMSDNSFEGFESISQCKQNCRNYSISNICHICRARSQVLKLKMCKIWRYLRNIYWLRVKLIKVSSYEENINFLYAWEMI